MLIRTAHWKGSHFTVENLSFWRTEGSTPGSKNPWVILVLIQCCLCLFLLSLFPHVHLENFSLPNTCIFILCSLDTCFSNTSIRNYALEFWGIELHSWVVWVLIFKLLLKLPLWPKIKKKWSDSIVLINFPLSLEK